MEKQKGNWFHSFTLANLAAGGASILVPLYGLHLGAGVGDIGLIAGISSLMGVPASILWGVLSDKWGARKFFAVIGFLGAAVSLFFMAFVDQIWYLIALNASFSVWWMAASSVATILVIEEEDKTNWERKIGSFNLWIGIGWLLGLILGLLWTTGAEKILPAGNALSYLFFVISAFVFIAFSLALAWIPERIKFKRRFLKQLPVINGGMISERFKYIPSRLYYILKPSSLISLPRKFDRDLSNFFFAVCFFFTGFSIFFIPLPVMLKNEVKMNSSMIYLVYIINSAASAFLYNKSGVLVKRIGSIRTLSASLFARTILFPSVILPLLFVSNFSLQFLILIIIFFLIGITWAGINIANLTFLSNLAPERIKGQVFGMYNAAVGLSGVIGSLLGGYIAQYIGYLGAYISASVFVGIGIGIILKAFGRVNINEPSDEPHQ